MSALAAVNRRSWWLAGAGALVCLIGALIQPWNFFPGYLQAVAFFAALSIGSVGLLLIHSLTGGQWGIALDPLLRAGARTVPWVAVAVLPLFAGMKSLYPWASPAVLAEHPLIAAKQGYLNLPFFAIRAAVYLGTWFWLSRLVIYPRRPNQGAAGVGLVALALTGSFAAFDWLMSIEPEWFSSLYGAIYLVGALVSTFAFAALWLAGTQRLTDRDRHDLGKLLFMAVMLWAYLSFSQYLIIWSGQLPEELVWYQHRAHAPWNGVGLALVLGLFVIPFFLLLSRRAKVKPRLLTWVASLLLLMRAVELVWLVRPSYPGAASLPIWEPAAYLAVGAAWLACFFRALEPVPGLTPVSGASPPHSPSGPQDQPVRRPRKGAR